MKVSIERQQREMAERHERASQDQASIEDLNTRLDGERTRSDEIQKYCGELETERDAMVAKLEDHDRVKDLLTVHEEREAMLLNNIEDLKQKHAFTLKEFESERAELNDVVQRYAQRHLLTLLVSLIGYSLVPNRRPRSLINFCEKIPSGRSY